MADPVTVTKQLTAASVNNIALNQTPAGAGFVVLNGAAVVGGVAVLDTGRRVLITSSGNDSGITFTVAGFDGQGSALSETISGGNAVAVATTKDFKSISSIANSGAVAPLGIQVGTNGVGSTAWQTPNYHISPFELAVQMVISGTANATLEVSEISPLQPMPIYGLPPSIPVPYGWPMLTALTAGAAGVIDTPIACWRLTINSGSGIATATGIQAGIRN